MERLTRYFSDWAHGAEGVSDKGLTGAYCRGKFEATAIVDRLAAIEDILGDTYDLDHLRELVEADRDGRCVVLPVKPGSVVRCVNGEPGKQEIVDCITIYAGGRMTYGFHEFGVRETYVDEWSEDEAENYVPVESAEQALRERSEDG